MAAQKLHIASKARSAARKALCLILCTACALTVTGCKDSDVLTEKFIGEVGQYEIDYSLPPISVPDPNAVSVSGYEEAESDDVNNLEIDHNEPDYDADDPTTDQAVSDSFESSYQNPNSPSVNGDLEGSSDQTGDDGSEGDEGGEQGGTSGEFDAPGETGEDGQEDDPNEDNTDNPPSGSDATGNTGTMSGEDGDYSELPYAKKIAAAGQYATIVQSLGGKGALAAANGQWKTDMQSKGVYPGELDEVVGISEWGDGTTMNASVVQAIIDSGADTVLTSNTYGGVTQSCANALMEAGINVVVMPTLGVTDALDADIENAVQIVGALLEGAQAEGVIEFDGPAMAARWKQVKQACIDGVSAARGTSGLATTLLNGYSYNRKYQGSPTSSDGVIPDSATRIYSTFIDSWDSSCAGTLSVWNARTASYRGTYPMQEWSNGMDSASAEWWAYEISMRDVFIGGIGLAAQSSGKAKNNLFSLYQYYYQLAGLADPQVYFEANRDNGAIYGSYALWGHQSSADTINAGDTFALGDEEFPALVVRDVGIASKVQASAQYEDQANLRVGAYNYGKSYTILIMPEGASGSWADGTFESYLMIPWAYCGTQYALGHISDISSCDSYVQAFYQEFYRCDDFSSSVQNYGNMPKSK